MGRLNTAALEILGRVLADGGFVWEAAQKVDDELGAEQRELLIEFIRAYLKDQVRTTLEYRRWVAGLPT